VTSRDSRPYGFSTDSCTASSFLSWIDANRGKSFFATLWTEQTPYPYAASKRCLDAIAAKGEVLRPPNRLDADWPRYAAALCDADQMLSEIMAGLRERNLSEDTLVVVTGDHGESFGQHGSLSHGSDIFEEQIRVPLLISAGHSLVGVDDRLASHLDIAPTITTAFGIHPSDEWEGNDLLGNRAPLRVYFYTAWGNYQIGYREADDKYIYDVVHSKLSSYQLTTDPYERRDLGGNAQSMSLIAQWYRNRTNFANTLH
jgi:lipoteichoic acid synthase